MRSIKEVKRRNKKYCGLESIRWGKSLSSGCILFLIKDIHKINVNGTYEYINVLYLFSGNLPVTISE